MKLTQKEKEFIANEFHAGHEIDDIAFATGLTVQAVKRALSDMKVLNLSWYKPKYEHDLVTLLRTNGIYTVGDLAKYKLVER